MTQTDLALQPLFTGENEIDDKLRQAYALGVPKTDRKPVLKNLETQQKTERKMV